MCELCWPRKHRIIGGPKQLRLGCVCGIQAGIILKQLRQESQLKKHLEPCKHSKFEKGNGDGQDGAVIV